MKKKISQQDFKAVEFMRQRRDELSELYVKDTTEFWKQLKEVRKKYRGKFHQKKHHAA